MVVTDWTEGFNEHEWTSICTAELVLMLEHKSSVVAALSVVTGLLLHVTVAVDHLR